jgi:PEP-CTERM motif
VSGLVASDFTEFNFSTGVAGSTHPDFAGASMFFGVLVFGMLNGSDGLTATYDNTNITVNQTPLPAALPLFASGLGALGLLGWCRKRKGVTTTAA